MPETTQSLPLLFPNDTLTALYLAEQKKKYDNCAKIP